MEDEVGTSVLRIRKTSRKLSGKSRFRMDTSAHRPARVEFLIGQDRLHPIIF